MLNTASLSLDQAPPISIPFRFFLTAPLFAIAAGLELLIFGSEMLISRWSPFTLGLTHLITLGVLSMVMCGAMLQMLPVIAGSPVPHVVLVGRLTHGLLLMGTILLKISFVTGSKPATLLALTTLGVGFLIFIVAVSIALWRVVTPGATIQGMKMAVIALAATVVLGILVAVGYSGIGNLAHLTSLTNIHLSWGILGWAGLLILSVSFQLVPMFQVTPEFPFWVKRHLPYSIFICLSAWLLLRLGFDQSSWIDSAATPVLTMAVSGYLLFSMKTLQLQSKRKRRVPDVTLLFWRLGMIVLGLCVLLWVGGEFYSQIGDTQYFSLLLGIGLIQGVTLSIINGMLYKIVPFLCWFHLQSRQMAFMCMTVKVPHMKEFVTDKSAKRQFYLHLLALVSTVAAAVAPELFVHPAALLFIASNSMLLANLVLAVSRFRTTFKLLAPSA